MNTLKKKAENIYLQELKKVESQLGTGVTYGSELAKLAHRLFNKKGQGNKFKGVYASDEVDKLDKENGYYIFNLDKRDEPGSHWIGIAKSKKGILVYDSFGRDTKKIIPNVYSIGNIKDTENDPEQKKWEDNCGSRVIAWLKVYDKYGPEVASLV